MSTDQEKRDKWNEREAKVRADLVDREVAEKRQKIKDYREVMRAEREQERLNETKDPNDDKRYWDKVKEDAHRLVSDGVAGYNSWDTGMSNLVSRCLLLARASWYDPIFPFREQIVGVKNLVVDFISDNTVGRASDWISRKRFKDADLPKIHVNAALGEDGGLDVQVTKDKQVSDDPAFAELKQHIDTGIVAWAMTQGYTLRTDRATGKQNFFHETDNSKMTQEVFERLNSDPEQGLEKFLAGRFQMPLTTSSTPGM